VDEYRKAEDALEFFLIVSGKGNPYRKKHR